MNSPSRNRLWVFALEIGFIVYCSRWAGSQLGLDSISANVEFLAVLGMWVGRMGQWASVISKNVSIWAGETIGKFLWRKNKKLFKWYYYYNFL